MSRRLAAAAICVAAATLAGCAEAEPADLILFGGKVAIVDQAFSIHEAIVVRDGRVLAVGDSDLASRYDATRRVDLAGRLVVPGFNDTHTHIRGNARRHIDLAGVESITEIQSLIRSKIAEMGGGRVDHRIRME